MATARTGGLESTAIRSKQAEHLRKRVFLSPLFNIATAIIIVALLWPVAAHPQVLLWLGLVCMLNVGQLVLVPGVFTLYLVGILIPVRYRVNTSGTCRCNWTATTWWRST